MNEYVVSKSTQQFGTSSRHRKKTALLFAQMKGERHFTLYLGENRGP